MQIEKYSCDHEKKKTCTKVDSSSALHIQVFHSTIYFHTISHIKIFPTYIQYYKVAKVHKTIHGSHHPSPHYVTD